ncbi:MAG: choice-of-anchor J domain-containing protein [Muribaculaceae bacterium]|nr:choice-of-anchor J domain-containing protein [Muribaculaceae bacterium]
MKIKYIFQALLALLPMGAMTSCQNSFDDPGLVVPEAKNTANTTIAEFKDRFAEENMQLCPYKDAESKTPYIVKGRVISSDATGNIYQTLCIQDETSAMTFAIRRAGLYDYYHVGQEIVVDLTGLWVGKYNYLLQIGWLNEDNYGDPSMGRVDFSVFQQHVELNGLPKLDVTYITPQDPKPADKMYCLVENIDRLPSSPGEEFYNLQGQLVEFRNVKFEGGGELPYAPYQESVNRFITQEGNSSKLTVRTSGYATFYSDTLPEGTGTIRGILSYYASDPSYATTDGSVNGWQLLIRSLEDVEFNQKGQKDDPYTIEEAAGMQDQSRHGWVKGYIVGSVKAGVTTVTSNADIIFGQEAEMDNNLVIAPSADVADWSRCMAVALPQGSAIRQYGNLADNPAIYKKSILVNGTLSKYLGIPGVQGTGASDSFEIDGVVIGGDTPVTPADGDGSANSPYTVEQISAMNTVNGTNLFTDVWAIGYIVGYVDTGIKSYACDESVKFEIPAAVATNLLLADSPDERDWNKCISVNLPSQSDARSQLNLKDNPGNLGKELKIKGNVTRYVGISGVKEPSEFILGEGGDDNPVTPPASDGIIYEGLISNSNGWTFDDVTVPSAATKGIWQWDDQYKVLKASAYISGKNYEALSYAISPEINLKGYSSASISFDQAAKFQTTLTTLCGFVVREVGTTSWTALKIPVWPAADTWNASNSGTIDLSAYIGKNIQVAFKYASSTSGADTWQIKNLKVTGTK